MNKYNIPTIDFAIGSIANIDFAYDGVGGQGGGSIEYDIVAVYQPRAGYSNKFYSGLTSNIEAMYINDEKVTPVQTMTFQTEDEITVKYKLINNTELASFAFDGCSNLSSVSLPSTLKTVNPYSFRSCSKLTSIDIPNGVTTIDSNAFITCSGITSVSIPEGVTKIGAYAFGGTSIKNLKIPSTVTSIGSRAFHNCGKLDFITVTAGNSRFASYNNALVNKETKTLLRGSNNTTYITNDVFTIGEGAFSGCETLSMVSFPSSVSTIESEAFYGCKKLNSVSLTDNVYNIASRVFFNCYALTSLTLPNNITVLKNQLFAQSGLVEIEIQESVSDIENGVFYGCKSLKTITSNATTAPNIAYDTFDGVRSGGTLYYPCGSDYSSWMSTSNYYLGKYGWSEECFGGGEASYDITAIYSKEYGDETQLYLYLDSIERMWVNGEEVSPSKYYYLDEGENIVQFQLSSSYVDGYAFSSISDLKSIEFGERITEIQNDAIQYCNKLESISFRYDTYLGSRFAGEGCENLTAIYWYSSSGPGVTDDTFTQLVYSNGTFYYPCGNEFNTVAEMLPETWQMECFEPTEE